MFVSYGAIDSSSVSNLNNMVKVFDVSTMAYYDFEQRGNDGSVLHDAFRDQVAVSRLITMPGVTVGLVRTGREDVTNPLCDTLDAN